MRKFLFSIILLCIFNLCTIKAQQEQGYQLTAVETSDMKYSSKLTLTYEDNRLVKVTETSSYGDGNPYSDWYIFDYNEIDKRHVTMIYQNEDWDKQYIDLYLNSDGAVGTVMYEDGEWYEFQYNSDKQLSRMIQHHEDGEIETTNMTYDNGSLVKVNGNDGDAYYMSYTSEETLIPIANKAGLMYNCDIFWGIDLDEFNYVYMAGLLGKAPAYLPIATRDGNYSTRHYNWNLDDNGIPTECSYNPDSRDITYKYYWTKTETGNNNITDNTKAPTVKGVYTTSGMKTSCQQKGLNIIQFSDGTTRKIVLK